ncbi:UvrD-helicase domain-containing protein [Methanoplanus endosymbiosus]|uniref:DNA 3'-5' helicase n=1 Tax=Methanoplanus endosymbiosus TaxID=33865 RepID=A0A9E7PQA1_9EURY|nr:UvrD-helicase domain-containing protein [Methanoplanus endosymbiosus]UUX92871.1 UvrD-helicase domain-containing protein [Methanoplanus endosymbiosus]
MPVRYFRGRRGEYFHELEQIKEVAGVLEGEFKDENVFLLTNIKLAKTEIDCIILTVNGPVILDLKNYCGTVYGDDYPQKPWKVVTNSGEETELHRNLFDQLITQRGEFNRQYQKIREKHFGYIDQKEAGRIAAWGYFRKGSTYPDGQIDKWEFPWFAVVTADSLAERLCYNNTGYELLDEELEVIVKELYLDEYDFDVRKKTVPDGQIPTNINGGSNDENTDFTGVFYPDDPLASGIISISPDDEPTTDTISIPEEYGQISGIIPITPKENSPSSDTGLESIRNKMPEEKNPERIIPKNNFLPSFRIPEDNSGEPPVAEGFTSEDITERPNPLSDDQKKAVLSDSRKVRVIAGAGTGKTEVITRKILHLLLVQKVPPSSIVAFTYTKKAARSMKGRIYEQIENLAGEEACARLGEMYVGTIHGFCLKLLQQNCGYRNYTELDEHKEMAFLLRTGWKFLKTDRGNYAGECNKFLNSLNIYYSELIDPSKLEREAPEFSEWVKSYENEMTKFRLLSYNRMVDLAVSHIMEKPEIIRNIRHLIVDEYQDINHAQEKLIKLIGFLANLFVVGDPRQTIYQWRGSDDKCFENFGKDAQSLSLSNNRRSGREIIDFSNSIAKKSVKNYDDLIPVRESESGVLIIENNTDLSEAKWIAKQIKRYVDCGKCRYRDFAVILRSVKISAPLIIKTFREEEIPAIIAGNVNLFNSPEVEGIAKIIIWFDNDGYYKKKKRDYFINGDDLLFSGISDWKGAAGEIFSENYESKIRALKKVVLSGGFPNLIDIYYTLLEILGYKSLNPENPDEYTIIANLGRFSELLNDFESANRMGGSRYPVENILSWLTEYINAYAADSYGVQTSDDVKSAEAVQIVTIHQAKGLEWPVVFVPSMNQGIFPSTKKGGIKEKLIPSGLYDAERYEGSMESERKLHYVASTRAKDLLVLSYYAYYNNKSKEPGLFIKDALKTGAFPFINDRENLPDIEILSVQENDENLIYTVGELVNYRRCPYMFRLRSVLGYQSGIADMIGYGNALHHCLYEAAEEIKNGSHPVNAVVHSVDSRFTMPFVNEEKLNKIKSSAKKQLARFASENEQDMRVIKNVESKVEFPANGTTISGRADIILKDGEGIEVRDYKTSDTVATDEEVAFQVQLYSLGFNSAGEKVNAGSVAYIKDCILRDVDVSDESLTNAKDMAVDYIQKIGSQEFCPNPGEICRRCDYKSICRWKEGEIDHPRFYGIDNDGKYGSSYEKAGKHCTMDNETKSKNYADRTDMKYSPVKSGTGSAVDDRNNNPESDNYSQIISACDALLNELHSASPPSSLKALSELRRYTEGEAEIKAKRLYDRIKLRVDNKIPILPDEIVSAGESLADMMLRR